MGIHFIILFFSTLLSSCFAMDFEEEQKGRLKVMHAGVKPYIQEEEQVRAAYRGNVKSPIDVQEKHIVKEEKGSNIITDCFEFVVDCFRECLMVFHLLEPPAYYYYQFMP
ncbi:MAG: hypothetical protein ACTSXG_04135 [Alphaproteobacteria bacterium]